MHVKNTGKIVKLVKARHEYNQSQDLGTPLLVIVIVIGTCRLCCSCARFIFPFCVGLLLNERCSPNAVVRKDDDPVVQIDTSPLASTTRRVKACHGPSRSDISKGVLARVTVHLSANEPYRRQS